MTLFFLPCWWPQQYLFTSHPWVFKDATRGTAGWCTVSNQEEREVAWGSQWVLWWEGYWVKRTSLKTDKAGKSFSLSASITSLPNGTDFYKPVIFFLCMFPCSVHICVIIWPINTFSTCTSNKMSVITRNSFNLPWMLLHRWNEGRRTDHRKLEL